MNTSRLFEILSDCTRQYRKGEEIERGRVGQVRLIRSDPRPNTRIAAEYGVSNVLVSLIKRRRAWSHVQ